MRLGAQECRLKSGTLAHDLYGQDVVRERHRHRYEFNNRYRQSFEDLGLVISGKSMDDLLVEIVELPQQQHPWFLGLQSHPEFTSTPRDGHPLFIGFVRAAREYKAVREGVERLARESVARMKLCGFEVGLDRPLFLIAGPCVIESEQLQLDTAGHAARRSPRGSAFRSSSSPASTRPIAPPASSFRGPGMEEGLRSSRGEAPARRAGA